MTPRPSRAAFTHLEGLVAAAVTVVIFGLVIGFLRFTVASFRRTEDRLDARESACRAFVSLRTTLISCADYGIEDGGSRLRYVTLRASGEVRRTPAGALELALPAQRPTLLIPAGVTRFQVEEVHPGLVKLTLEIARPTAGGRLAPLPPLTAVEEIFIPAAARSPGDDAIPWNEPIDRPHA